MLSFAVAPCSIDDGPALAKVHISAFWTDPTWVVIWPGKTLEYVTSQYVLRMPHTLLLDPIHRRHQKVVDIDKGTIIGYARWMLPEIDIVNLNAIWRTAQVPRVSEERERNAGREYTFADYSFDHSLDELDKPLDEMMNRLISQKNYIVLENLAVDPEYWGQGVGTLLVQSGIEEIEKMGLGLDIFVRAKKAALGVYKRAGFELVDQLIQDASSHGIEEEYGAYFLIRRTKKKSHTSLS